MKTKKQIITKDYRSLQTRLREMANTENKLTYWGFVKDIVDKDEYGKGAIVFYIPHIDNILGSYKIALPQDPNSFLYPVPGMLVEIHEIDEDKFEYVNVDSLLHNKIYDYDTGGYLEEDENLELYGYDENNNPINVMEYYIPGSYYIEGLHNNRIELTYNKDNKGRINLLTAHIDNDKLIQNGIYINEEDNSDGLFDIDNTLELYNNNSHEIIIKTGKMRLLSNTEGFYFWSAQNFQVETIDVNIKSENTNIISNAINLGKDANEQVVLGNQLQSWLSAFIDELLKISVVTNMGPSGPIINPAPFLKLKTELGQLLSQTTKTL